MGVLYCRMYKLRVPVVNTSLELKDKDRGQWCNYQKPSFAISLRLGLEVGLGLGLEVDFGRGLEVGLEQGSKIKRVALWCNYQKLLDLGLGFTVGLEVGLEVGLGLGFEVGLGLGLDVGLGLGFEVGLGVGFSKSVCLYSRMTVRIEYPVSMSNSSCTNPVAPW